MGTSIGKVIDYLVAGLAAPALAVDPNAEVADDLPTTAADTLIVIGRESPESTDSGSNAIVYGALGGTRIDEAYTVPGHVYVLRQGPGVKDARDAAVALINVLVGFVHGDPYLGGAVNRAAQLTSMTLIQSGDPGDTGADVWCSITFGIAITNNYIP